MQDLSAKLVPFKNKIDVSEFLSCDPEKRIARYILFVGHAILSKIYFFTAITTIASYSLKTFMQIQTTNHVIYVKFHSS